METIRQTWTIPKSRQIHIDVRLPDYIPTGEAEVVMIIMPDKKNNNKQALMKLAGCLKDSETFRDDPVSIQKALRDEWE